MKVLVPVKRVADAKIKVRPLADGSDVDLKLAKMVLNPFDEIAVEKAVQLKEAGAVTEVIALTVGPDKAVDSLRVAMAIGADRGIHIQTNDVQSPLTIAKVIAHYAKTLDAPLVLMGKQAIDDDAHQVGGMVSALLGVPIADAVSELTVNGLSAGVTLEGDEGQVVATMMLPGVVTADLRLANPRYVTLPMMGQARKKTVEALSLESVGVTPVPGLVRLGVETPPAKPRGVILESVPALVEALKARHLI